MLRIWLWVYYWFDKSTKRKTELSEYCVFRDNTYKHVLKHVSMRLFSLEYTVSGTLEMYQPLKSYFLSGSEKHPRYKRLPKQFDNPMTEVCLLGKEYPKSSHLSAGEFFDLGRLAPPDITSDPKIIGSK